jgi:hypothetical protein
MYITLHYARASSFGSVPIVFRLRWACHFLPWLTTTFPCRCCCCGTTIRMGMVLVFGSYSGRRRHRRCCCCYYITCTYSTLHYCLLSTLRCLLIVRADAATATAPAVAVATAVLLELSLLLWLLLLVAAVVVAVALGYVCVLKSPSFRFPSPHMPTSPSLLLRAWYVYPYA